MPMLVTTCPSLSVEVVVIFLTRPFLETTQRLVGMTWKALMYDATTTLKSTRFSETGVISPAAPVTTASLPS